MGGVERTYTAVMLEDQVEFTHVLKPRLKDIGVQLVATVSSVESVVEYFKDLSDDVDLLIADLELNDPDGLTGIDAVRRVWDIYPVPTVIITAYRQRFEDGIASLRDEDGIPLIVVRWRGEGVADDQVCAAASEAVERYYGQDDAAIFIRAVLSRAREERRDRFAKQCLAMLLKSEWEAEHLLRKRAGEGNNPPKGFPAWRNRAEFRRLVVQEANQVRRTREFRRLKRLVLGE